MYKPEKLLNRYFVFAWIVSLALCIGHSVFNSTITVFANSHGYSNTFAGSLSIGYLFGALAGRFIGGRCTDYRTRREGMIIGTAAFLAATVLFCLPIAGNGIVMMLLRFGHGFGFGCATTSYYVAAVDVAPEDKKAVALGINFTGQSLGYVLITVLLDIFVTDGSYLRLFTVTVGIVAAAVIFSVADTYEKGSIKEKTGEKKKRGSIIEPAAFPYALLIIIYDGALTLPFFYIMPLAVSKGLISGGNNVFIFVGLGMLAAYLILPKIAERFGTLVGMIPAYLFGIVSNLILLYTKSNSWFAFAGFFYGTVIATLPVMQNATVNNLPDHKKGAGTATLNGALDLTMGIGPLLWGILIDRTGYFVPLVSGVVMYAAALAVHIILKKKMTKPDLPGRSRNNELVVGRNSRNDV